MNLLDSHDTARFLSITGSKNALRLAVLFMFTYPGAPCIYYGDEIGLEGGKDPDCRRAFPWNEQAWDRDLLNYFKVCIRLRNENPALRTGEWRIRSAGDGVITIERWLHDNKVVVILNNTASTHSRDLLLDDPPADGTLFREAFTNQVVTTMDGRLTNLSVLPHSGAVLIRQH
jgi:glycosidase